MIGRTAAFHPHDRANSIFWTRALNIPFPHSYVFPGSIEEQDKESSFLGGDYGASVTQVPGETSNWKQSRNSEVVIARALSSFFLCFFFFWEIILHHSYFGININCDAVGTSWTWLWHIWDPSLYWIVYQVIVPGTKYPTPTPVSCKFSPVYSLQFYIIQLLVWNSI